MDEEDNWVAQFRPVLSPAFSLPRVHFSIISNTFIILRFRCEDFSYEHLPPFSHGDFFGGGGGVVKKHSAPGLVITVYRCSIIKVYETGCVSVSVSIMCMREALPFTEADSGLSPVRGSQRFPLHSFSRGGHPLPENCPECKKDGGTMKIRHLVIFKNPNKELYSNYSTIAGINRHQTSLNGHWRWQQDQCRVLEL